MSQQPSDIFSDEEDDFGQAKQEPIRDDLDSENDLPKNDGLDDDLDGDSMDGQKYNPLGGDNNDELENISDMDVDEDGEGQNQKEKSNNFQKNEYGDDDDDSEMYGSPDRNKYDDYGVNKNSKKIKKSSRDKDGSKKKKKRQSDDQTLSSQVQKVSGKQEKNDKLQAKADFLCAELLQQMRLAEKKDQKYQQLGRPAFQKLLMVNKLSQKLNNSIAKQCFIEEQGLDLLTIWIQNCGSNISFRKKILLLVKQLSNAFNSDNLINSYIVTHCQTMKSQIQNKEKAVSEFDRETKKLYVDLVDSWGPILGDRK